MGTAIAITLAATASAGAAEITGTRPGFPLLALPAPEGGVDQGKDAVRSTLGNLADRFLRHLRGGSPGVTTVPPGRRAATMMETLSLGTVAVRDLRLSANPLAYDTRGLSAGADLTTLGLDSRLSVQVGTERMGQTLTLAGDCGRLWLPTEVRADLGARTTPSKGADAAWTGGVRTAWGTACAKGATGWRLTAGLRDTGPERTGSVGLEYRPDRFGPLPAWTGLTAFNADLNGDAAELGAEMDLGRLGVTLGATPVRLKAGAGWEEDGSRSLRLGTSLRF
jgi:hypothetical protein